jgi:hypothetical protein
VGFKRRKREEVYSWVNQMLRRQGYEEWKRSERGLVRRYLEKMTGLSRAQTTRLNHGVLAGRGGEATAVPAATLRAALHQGGHRAVGSSGRSSRKTQRAGHAEAAAASLSRFRRAALPTFSPALGGTLVPAASKPLVSGASRGLSVDAAYAGVHRGATPARSARPARVLAGGHGASGRPGRGQGRVPHQRCR